MPRLTELRLPPEHDEAALKAALLVRLGIDADALEDFRIFRRAHDARNATRIFSVCTVNVNVKDAAAVSRRCAADQHIMSASDMRYRHVAQANIHSLYPAGEGAGYAGGILSAAMDGIRAAEALALQMMGTGIEGGRNETKFFRPEH